MIFVDVTGACLLPLQSGIPRTTRGLYRKLVEKRQDVTPLVWQPFYFGYTGLTPESKRLLDDPFPSSGDLGKAPSDSTLSLLGAGFRDALRCPRRICLGRRMREEDSLLLTSLFPDNRLLFLNRLVREPGRKIAIFHDAIPLLDPRVAFWEKKLHLSTLRLLGRMNLVLCVSRDAEKELKRLWLRAGIPHARTKVIVWPVPFRTERPAFSPPDGYSSRILYVARLKKLKNHECLFRACEMLWKEKLEFTLELIGCEDVPEESRDILEQIRSLQKKGFPVVWRGHVRDEELHRAYQNATFTVFPSLMEGFGLPIVESFWHGRTVICGNAGAIGETSEGPGVVSIPMGTGALAAAMKHLLTDRIFCAELAAAAYNRPVRNWEDYWKELESVLS